MQKKSKKSRKNKPRTEPKPEPTPRDDGLVNRDNSATGNGNSNPYQ
jgi:hypothetical protein